MVAPHIVLPGGEIWTIQYSRVVHYNYKHI